MTERTFKTDYRCCTICDCPSTCVVAKSTQASPWGMRRTDEELAICSDCMKNLQRAFERR